MLRNRWTVNVWSTASWLAFSLYVCLESLRIGIGRPSDPGPGFIFFWSGLVLAALAVLGPLRACVSHRDRETTAPRQTNWSQILLALVVLGLYALFIERIGFLLTTAVMMGLIVRLAGEHRWSRIVTFALGATLGAYAILQVWLQTRLPPGLLGWLETMGPRT